MLTEATEIDLFIFSILNHLLNDESFDISIKGICFNLMESSFKWKAIFFSKVLLLFIKVKNFF